MLLLTPGYSYQTGPHDLTAVLLPGPVAPLPDYPANAGHPEVSVPGLAPYIFGIRPLGWSAITRCFFRTLFRERFSLEKGSFKGWLLLSLPPSCLREGVPYRLTLNRDLGTLTSVLVVPIMASRLTRLEPDWCLLR